MAASCDTMGLFVRVIFLYVIYFCVSNVRAASLLPKWPVDETYHREQVTRNLSDSAAESSPAVRITEEKGILLDSFSDVYNESKDVQSLIEDTVKKKYVRKVPHAEHGQSSKSSVSNNTVKHIFANLASPYQDPRSAPLQSHHDAQHAQSGHKVPWLTSQPRRKLPSASEHGAANHDRNKHKIRINSTYSQIVHINSKQNVSSRKHSRSNFSDNVHIDSTENGSLNYRTEKKNISNNVPDVRRTPLTTWRSFSILKRKKRAQDINATGQDPPKKLSTGASGKSVASANGTTNASFSEGPFPRAKQMESYYQWFLRRYRSKDAFWALMCVSGLMMLLFFIVCYSKMWKRRELVFWDATEPVPNDDVYLPWSKSKSSIQDLLKDKLQHLPKLPKFEFPKLPRRKKTKSKKTSDRRVRYEELRNAQLGHYSSDEEVVYNKDHSHSYNKAA